MVELTEGMVELLNAGTFELDFLAKRVTYPNYEIEQGGLQVSVFPGTRTTETASRGTNDKITYTVFVATQYQTVDLHDLDEVMLVVHQMEQEVRKAGGIANRPYIGFSDLEAGKPPYDLDVMERVNSFVTVTGYDFLDYA